MQITIDFYGNLDYYSLQTTANKFAVYLDVYVVKKYLNTYNSFRNKNKFTI